MKYQFFPIESRIVDFLLFPLGVDYSEARRREAEKNERMDDEPAHLEGEWASIERSLKPFEKRIHKFYFDTYSIPELILKRWGPFDHGSAQAYFQSLLELDESVLAAFMWTKLKEDAAGSGPTEDAAAILADSSQALSLFESLPIEDEEKWRLQSLLRTPKAHLAEWIRLMRELEPVFEAYYEAKRPQVEALGERIAQTMNASNGEAFEHLTKGLIHSVKEMPERILVSCMEPISIQVAATSQVPHVLWGLDVEEVLRHVSEKKENELRERVQIFKNLGDATRYEVLKLIARGVETAKRIASTLQVSQPTVSYHINNLLFAKIIYLDRANGRYVYKIDQDLLRQACRGLFEDLMVSEPRES